jgi:hypothetical protein
MREANDRGYECLILSDCTGATEWGNHTAALRMVTMRGGIFGCVATSARVAHRASVHLGAQSARGGGCSRDHPNVAAWGTGQIDNVLNAAGTSAAKVGTDALAKAGVVYDGLKILGGGAILAGMLLGAIAAFLIDKRY